MRKGYHLHFWLFALMLVSFLFLAGSEFSAAQAQNVSWKLQAAYPPPEKIMGHWGAYGQAAEVARQVKERTQGKFDIKVYPPDALFKAMEAPEAVKRGAVEMILSNGAYHVGILPEANLDYGLPYGVKTSQEAAHLLFESEYFMILRKAYLEKHQVLLLGLTSTSAYNYISRFPIRKMEDMKGKKIRTSGAYGKVAQAHGATPVNLAPAEQYMALQRGTVDGTIFPAYAGITYKMFEVAKFHSWLPIYAMIGASLVGLRLPIVMGVANRALSCPLSVWGDHSDVMAVRDTGWIQIFAENGQQAFDLTLCAFRIAEDPKVLFPVMIHIDGFHLSHVVEPLYLLDQKQVNSFLPPFVHPFPLDPDNPVTMGAFTVPILYSEARKSMETALRSTRPFINYVFDEFAKLSGRQYKPVEHYRTEDADTLLLTMGSFSEIAMEAVDQLRKQGEKVGLIRLRLWRPFPFDELRQATENCRTLVIPARQRAMPVPPRCSVGRTPTGPSPIGGAADSSPPTVTGLKSTWPTSASPSNAASDTYSAPREWSRRAISASASRPKASRCTRTTAASSPGPATRIWINPEPPSTRSWSA